MESKKRGGKQPGAGRPTGTKTTGAGNPANRFQVRLPDDVSRWLDAQGGNQALKKLVLDAYASSSGQSSSVSQSGQPHSD